MTTNPGENGTGNSVALGTITREKVEARAAELAVINGHAARRHLSKPAWEQARFELASEPAADAGQSLNQHS